MLVSFIVHSNYAILGKAVNGVNTFCAVRFDSGLYSFFNDIFHFSNKIKEKQVCVFMIGQTI